MNITITLDEPSESGEIKHEYSFSLLGDLTIRFSTYRKLSKTKKQRVFRTIRVWHQYYQSDSNITKDEILTELANREEVVLLHNLVVIEAYKMIKVEL